MKKFGVQFRLPNGEISCAGAVPFEAESAEEAIRMRVEAGGNIEAELPFDEMMLRYKAYCEANGFEGEIFVQEFPE
jgi:hypothetical protein